MATKRVMDGENGEGMKKPRMEGEEGDNLMEVRVLIDNLEASVIIGKAGSNVKRIRTESSAFVSILKAEGNSKERVMTVKGTVEFNVHALRLIAELLIANEAERKAANGEVAEGEVGNTWQYRLLFNKALAGAIIGRGGEIIRKMQTESGARLSLSTDPIGMSTEKTCTITGTVDQLSDVLMRLLTQIHENPIRAGTQSVLYVPGAPVFAPPGPYGAPPSPYGMPPGPSYGGMPPSPYGMPSHMGMPAGAGPPGAQKTEKIVIPTVCAGTVIGKGGTIIRDIKLQSGTNISVANPDPNTPGDRIVSITGSQQGIATAIYMIRQRVESYQPPAGMGVM